MNHCLKCPHKWEQRKVGRPDQCPRCKNPKWDKPKSKHDVESELAVTADHTTKACLEARLEKMEARETVYEPLEDF